ncbi:extracellular solute-binding protein [Komagataeibacter sucrofermentans]|uniref:ABC transporter substrate-binding protein n=1 Tax=Komagataeibacter sucrofermentans TaxID=1053551 RepID=A0A318QQM7_9PROT|nr:extracellular solute-binding protein [Komagataeibacter sucrofermentans]PYD79612.1 ABC transporter substrate-binding protein [Komagataeibacter sucrofermentans]GBQ49720.1 spermidine/putrescine ABC transporter substrate-binding periplasmic protein [Komagataeibacter sucrofermentans DSM 15973]
MFQIVPRRSLSAILPGLLAALIALPVPWAGVQAAARIRHSPALVVASTEPQLDPAQNVAFFQPFTRATGQAVTRRAWTGALADLESHGLQAGNGGAWSLAFAEDSTIRAACVQGLVVHLAGSAANPDGCGAPGLATQVVVAWDQTWRESAPRWNDFWDIVRFPGKRGLRRDPRTTLEIALLADGVPPAQVYGQLATPQGVDRAFRKLSQLRPYITWWSTPNEAASLLSRKQVLMGSAPLEAVNSVAARGEQGRIGVNADMALSYDLSWAVVAGQSAERLGRSRDLLHFIVQPDRRSAFMAAVPARASAPAHPAVLLPMDVQFWQVNYASLSRRFETWLHKAG